MHVVPPDGLEKQTVVVVVGAGVGGANVVVVVGLGLVVVVVALERSVVVVVAGTVVVVVADSVVVVEGAAKGIDSEGLASLEINPTITPETTPELTKIVWVRRRTRARRRSRCCGVREWVLIQFSSTQSLTCLGKGIGVTR